MAAILDLNDNCITLTALYNKISAVYVNDAVATVTIKDSDGVALVTSQAMPYVAGSDGVYRAVIISSVDLGNDGDTVQVEITATAGDGSVYHSLDDTVRVIARTLLS